MVKVGGCVLPIGWGLSRCWKRVLVLGTVRAGLGRHGKRGGRHMGPLPACTHLPVSWVECKIDLGTKEMQRENYRQTRTIPAAH